MASYQELETRLTQLQRMVEFVMKSISLAQPSPLVGAPPKVVSMFDLYHAANQAGVSIDADPIPSQEAPVAEGEVLNG